jgi:hypothetical protein
MSLSPHDTPLDVGCYDLLVDITRALLLDVTEGKRLIAELGDEIMNGAEPEWDTITTPDLYEVYDIALEYPEDARFWSVSNDISEWLDHAPSAA